MDIHEYQGKEILASYGVKVQRGYVANNPQEAVAAAKQLTLRPVQDGMLLKPKFMLVDAEKGVGLSLLKIFNK